MSLHHRIAKSRQEEALDGLTVSVSRDESSESGRYTVVNRNTNQVYIVLHSESEDESSRDEEPRPPDKEGESEDEGHRYSK